MQIGFHVGHMVSFLYQNYIMDLLLTYLHQATKSFDPQGRQ